MKKRLVDIQKRPVDNRKRPNYIEKRTPRLFYDDTSKETYCICKRDLFHMRQRPITCAKNTYLDTKETYWQ